MKSNDLSFEIDFCRTILRRQPYDLPLLEMLAGLLTRDGRIEEGLEMDRRIVSLDPENPVGHYNLACSLALQNDTEDAILSLRAALERGYEDFAWMMEDPDLETVRAQPEFEALIEEFKSTS